MEMNEENKRWNEFLADNALFFASDIESKKIFVKNLLSRRDKSQYEAEALDRLLRTAAAHIRKYGSFTDIKHFNMLVMRYVGGLTVATIATKFHTCGRDVYKGINQCIDRYLVVLMFGVDAIALETTSPTEPR